MPKPKPADNKAEPKVPTQKLVHRRRLRRFFLGIAGVLILVVAALTGYAFAYQNRVVPRTIIGGVAVGGLTRAEAANLLVSREKTFNQTQLALSYQAKDWQVKPADLGLSFQNDTALSAAYAVGRGGSVLHQFKTLITAPFSSRSFALAANQPTVSGTDYLQKNVQASIEQPFAETSLNLIPGHVTVKEGTTGVKLNVDQLVSDLAAAFAGKTGNITLDMTATSPKLTAAQAETARAQADAMLAGNWTIQAGNQNIILSPKDIVPWLSTPAQENALGLVIDDAKLQAYVASLVSKVQQTPTDATLTMTNGTVTIVQDGKDGVTLDLDQTGATLKTALMAGTSNRTITATSKVVHPDVWSGNLASLNLNQQIGTGTTDFTGSASNRVANITKGEQMISGQFVADGAEFSTLKALGPIDQAHGYVQGLVIVNGQTIPADGGGLCQVSTTLFRSVLNAGLPVTERTNHSYEVAYYQRGIGPGLDATIYEPSPDFKWKNDTGHPIFVQGSIKGNSLTFDLYGTSDGRTVVIDGPHTLETYQPSSDPLYVNTDTLPKGTTQYIDPPVPGAKTTATYTVTRGGQEINKQTFNSFYQAMPAQYLVGTKE